MINIEIINSPDKNFEGTYLSQFDHFLIGSSQRADIVIEDKDIDPLHITLEVKDNALICRSFKKDLSFLVNKKKYTGTKVIKPQDIITIGETEFKILNFIAMENTDENSIEELYASAIEKIPELEPVIFQLEREILILDRDHKE